jgi:hypothetical protein
VSIVTARHKRRTELDAVSSGAFDRSELLVCQRRAAAYAVLGQVYRRWP